jgi:hypothetical protein
LGNRAIGESDINTAVPPGFLGSFGTTLFVTLFGEVMSQRSRVFSIVDSVQDHMSLIDISIGSSLFNRDAISAHVGRI